MTKYIYIPNIIPPTEEQLEAMKSTKVQPLSYCPTCHYVLCSCGNCHNSELCNEVCLYEQPTTDE